MYNDLLESGIGSKDAYSMIDSLRSAAKTEELSQKQVQCGLLDDSTISDEAKAILYYGMLAGDKERELMDQLTDLGASAGNVGNFVREMYRIDQLPSEEHRPAQAEAFHASQLTEEEKKAVIAFMLGTDLLTETGNPTEYARFLEATEAGLSVDTYMDLRSSGAELESVLEFMDTGVPSEMAAKIAMETKALEPMPGSKSVSYLQRMQVVLDSDLSEQQKLEAFGAIGSLTDSTYGKIQLGYRMGMDLQDYVDLRKALPHYDADGNGTYTSKEVQAAIDAKLVGLSKTEKAILWQLQDASWKPKSNPYNREVGQHVYDALKSSTDTSQAPAADDPYTMMRALGLIP